MMGKIERGKVKLNVESWPTQHVKLADITWSIKKDAVEHRAIPLAAAQNHVKDFRLLPSKEKALNDPTPNPSPCR